jgi:hypothetical protein
MNQELMNMVQQAVNSIPDHVDFEIPNAFAEAFAALVAAAEREACAKVCDVLSVHPEYASDITKLAALAIRARGETK